MLPAAILVAVLAGLLRLEAERLELFPTEVGISLMVFVMIIGWVALLLVAARELRHSEHTRLRAEEALLDERFLLQTLVETSPDHIYFKDTQHRFIRINPSLARHLGLDDPAKAIGKTDTDFFAEEHAQKAALEEQGLFREGTPIVNLEEREVWPGRPDTWVATTKVPIRDADGTIIGLVGISRDITESRRTKEQLALLEAQKVESLSALAGGIAHDFNNLLVGVLGNASLALAELPEDTEARGTIHDILVAGERMAKLAREMLVYSGRGRFVLKPLDLSLAVADVARLLHGIVPARTHLDVDGLGRGLPPIDADETQVRQVIATLLTNAFEAVGEGEGTVTAATGVVDADHSYLAGFVPADELPEGQYVFLRVSDTGVGMGPEERTRIFEPFFTTKFTGRGLGLAALLGIVRGHRGGVKVETEPGQGTTFTILFPATSSRRPTAPERSELPPATGTVLVADDDKVVRTVTARMLERAGFDVLTADDGDAALDVFETRSDDIVAVVLDLVMPGRSGDEVLVEIHARRPGCPVLLCSGFTSEDVASPGSDRPVRFIPKPYTAEQLLGTLSELLAQTDR